MQQSTQQTESPHPKFIIHQNIENQTLQKPKSNRYIDIQDNQKSEKFTNKKLQQTINKQQLPKKKQNLGKIHKSHNYIEEQNDEKVQNGSKKQRILNGDGGSSLPQKVPHRYRLHQPSKNNKLEYLDRSQFNTIAVASFQRNNNKKKMRLPQITAISQDEKARMMRSSQGGRWIKSQTLMQENQQFNQPSAVILPTKPLANDSNTDLMVRNFYKHQSRYVEQLQTYIKCYQSVNQYMKDISSTYCKYKINLSDSLDEIKNKMQIFMESQINLSNLPIDRPDANWGQDELMKFYSNYPRVLIHKLTLNNEDINNEQLHTKLKKYKNCTYYGSTKDGNKHGFGYLHYFSGRFFQGLFQNDEKVQGFQMGDSELYLGEYMKNKRHGEGILKTNEYLISGTFSNDQFKMENSISTLPFQGTDGSQRILRKGFKIQFSNVTFYTETDIIIEKNNTNDIYIGFQNEQEQKHGEGVQIFANGDLYIGKYEQGAPEGYGEYYWNSRAFYRGQFLRGMRHGRGTWKMIHGDSYQGEYLNDKKSGEGVYLWKSGDRYKGSFENDYRHGYGEMNWHNGTSFKGQWLNGIQINKSFKLGNDKAGKSKGKKLDDPTSSSRVSFNTTKTRTRVIKKQQNNSSSFSANNKQTKYNAANQQHSRNSQDFSYNRKIHLEKLKAMLCPTNSTN